MQEIVLQGTGRLPDTAVGLQQTACPTQYNGDETVDGAESP